MGLFELGVVIVAGVAGGGLPGGWYRSIRSGGYVGIGGVGRDRGERACQRGLKNGGTFALEMRKHGTPLRVPEYPPRRDGVGSTSARAGRAVEVPGSGGRILVDGKAAASDATVRAPCGSHSQQLGGCSTQCQVFAVTGGVCLQ